tara:strand:- start:9746 stop:10996 length:1251 start_codon:yes stop_codon:yes gene_type:complete
MGDKVEPTEKTPARAFRRRVFYIPGYDPIHPRRYRELYRKEGTEQAAISGYDLSLTPKQGGGLYGWQVSAHMEAAAESQVEVLVWSDIVRSSMDNSIVGTYLQLLRTAWAYIGSGALFRLMRLRKGPIIAALYPIVFLLVQLVLAGVAGFGVSGAALWGLALLLPESLALIVAVLPGLVVGYALLDWFRRHDNRVFAYYLMHDFAYSAQYKGANPPALEHRMTEFRHAIAAALASDCDEVLVVGHSSGAHLAVSVLADLLRARDAPNGPALSFLSLGQVVPMVSFLPLADRLRADLNYLAQSDALTWVDVTAPGDGCAFALCDPVAVTGVAPEGKRWPLVLTAAFTQTLSAKRWKALRWRFFRLHFQYLCAFDRPRDYDYFRITAGPVSLAQRFAGSAASRSRIERAVSGYRSMKP